MAFCVKVSESAFTSSERSSVLIFSSVISSESTILTREWKEIEGSSELEKCLTWCLLVKPFNFFGRLRMKFLLHLRYIVNGYSIYHPCSTRLSTFEAYCLKFALSSLTRERVLQVRLEGGDHTIYPLIHHTIKSSSCEETKKKSAKLNLIAYQGVEIQVEMLHLLWGELKTFHVDTLIQANKEFSGVRESSRRNRWTHWKNLLRVLRRMRIKRIGRIDCGRGLEGKVGDWKEERG